MATLKFFDTFRYALESELSKLMTTSTLVETVSINYEDFTEGFLTCGTCLYTYDGDEHSPKLLPCSHTICKICLEKISSNATLRDPSGNFRCPICRELIQLPRGGVMAFPPSFLVNQLLDLVASQRREVIPKCSSHVTQELLYCEPCDLVFCNLCTGDKHDNQNANSPSHDSDHAIANQEHTVIPFSIAIKRMSEILLYKAQQCISKLDESSRNVLSEMQKLDQNTELSFEDINRTFQEVINIVDKRRQELLNCAKKIREDKRNVLREQLNNIELEKSRLEKECNEFKYQVEVRDISKKINDLKAKLNSVNTMLDPRENCFLRFEHLQNSTNSIQELVNNFGSIRTSNTFPSLCVATVGKCSIHLRSFANVTTFDYNGQRQKFGGDPILVTLVHNNSQQTIPCKLNDNRDGTYEVQFVPPKHGDFSMKITIFGRPIKTFPLEFTVSDHINPLCIYGGKGFDHHQFSQPTSLAIDNETGYVYVLDTGNGRIKKLLQNQCNNSPFRLICHMEEKHFENRAATGIAFCVNSRSLLVTNWRTKNIVKIDCDGRFIGKFGHSELLEPTCIAVNPNSGQILVADNSSNAIFLFQTNGEFVKKITTWVNPNTKKTESLGEINGLCFHPETNDIIVSSEKLLIYSHDGEFIKPLCSDSSNGKSKNRFYGVAVDKANNLLAARADKSRNIIQVIDYDSGLLKFSIDSNDAKLKRPSCLALTNDDHVIVVDLGNDCIKKYRYC
nr:tripartite motif-containing protein 2-like isoform X2 [Dermatophagoides farinae]XP_046911253.1 tripartite motif-containing protein 2-like isoform X2 [Dermatophagoides farinae]XP_046911254.1 tripartite motif-containing protein 2-like isoform X2 [Dermatophagoides farinae]